MLTDSKMFIFRCGKKIEMHLMKEEQILFPYIRQIEAYAAKKGLWPQVHCGTIAIRSHKWNLSMKMPDVRFSGCAN